MSNLSNESLSQEGNKDTRLDEGLAIQYKTLSSDSNNTQSSNVDIAFRDLETRLLNLENKRNPPNSAQAFTSHNTTRSPTIESSSNLKNENEMDREKIEMEHGRSVLAQLEERLQNRDSILHDLQEWRTDMMQKDNSNGLLEMSIDEESLPKDNIYSVDETSHNSRIHNKEQSSLEHLKSEQEFKHLALSTVDQEETFKKTSSDEDVYNTMFSSDSDETVASHEESFEEEVRYNIHRIKSVDISSTFAAKENKEEGQSKLLLAKPLTHSQRLEFALLDANQEKIELGQKYMIQLERNQELNQDLEILQDKNMSQKKRIELLERVNQLKQMELEKKTKIYSKTVQDLQEKLYRLTEEKKVASQNNEAQVQSLLFEISANAEKARQLDIANKGLTTKCETLSQRIESMSVTLNESEKRAERLQIANDAHASELFSMSQLVTHLKEENSTLHGDLTLERKEISELKKALEEKNSTIEWLQKQVENQPKIQEVKINSTSSVSVQTSTKPLDKKKILKQRLESDTGAYIDISRNACNGVKKANDEFISRILHVVRNQIPDTITQFLNYFGTKHHISDLIVDEWIEKMKQTYEKHINAVRLMVEKQRNLYNETFNKSEMLLSQKGLLEIVDKILFEDNVLGFKIETENSIISQEMYHEMTVKTHSLHHQIMELKEENEMLKTHINVLEKTQGKLSNVAELEKQLKRSQIKNETLQEEYDEYYTKCGMLQSELDRLQAAIRRSNLIILTEDSAYLTEEGSHLQVPSKTNSAGEKPNSVLRKYSSESIVIVPSDAANEDWQNSESIQADPSKRTSTVVIEETSAILKELKGQVQEVDSSIKVLLKKVSEHEFKKIRSNPSTAPEWLYTFLEERSTELMRASERLIVKYIQSINTLEKKIEKFMTLEEKLLEKEIGVYKETSELTFLKDTEDALQLKLDNLMMEACQRYPLRSVNQEYIQNEILAFLNTQNPVVQEVLSNVVGKILTLHKACTNYIDQLLEYTGDIEGLEETSTNISYSTSLRSYKSQKSGHFLRRQSTGSYIENGALEFSENIEMQRASQILERAQQLRTERVATRFLYWIHRLKLQHLQVEIFAIESKTLQNENKVLLSNFNLMLKLQKRHCDRLYSKLKNNERSTTNNLNKALSSLLDYILIDHGSQQQKLHGLPSASRRQQLQNEIPESELLSSSWRYYRENQVKRSNSPTRKESRSNRNKLPLRANRLQLQTREPLDREKLIHLQKPPSQPLQTKVEDKQFPIMREERANQGNYSIFRPNREKQQKASFLPRVLEEPKSKINFSISMKQPRKIPRRPDRSTKQDKLLRQNSSGGILGSGI